MRITTTLTTMTTTYTILKKLGKGSNGTVFLARNQEGMQVAIKEACSVDCDLIHERNILTKVHQKAQLTGIPRLLESLEEGGATLLVMDYIEGIIAYDLCKRSFSTPQAITAITELYRILDHLHQCEIAHEDIHLGNIMWTKDGHMAVIDLGNATTHTGRTDRTHHRAYRNDVRDLLSISKYVLKHLVQNPACPVKQELLQWVEDTLDEFHGPLTLPITATVLLARWKQVVQQVTESTPASPPASPIETIQ